MLRRNDGSRRSAHVAWVLAVSTLPAVVRAELAYVNGVAMELRSLAVRGEPRAAALQMAGRWQRREPGSPVMLIEAGGGVVVGRQRGPIHETALFKPGASGAESRVTVAVTHLGLGARALPRPPFQLPRGSRLLSVVETATRRGTSAEYVLLLEQSAARARTALQTAAAADQWVLQSADPIRAERGSESLVVVVQELPHATSVVIQHRRERGS